MAPHVYIDRAAVLKWQATVNSYCNINGSAPLIFTSSQIIKEANPSLGV